MSFLCSLLFFLVLLDLQNVTFDRLMCKYMLPISFTFLHNDILYISMYMFYASFMLLGCDRGLICTYIGAITYIFFLLFIEGLLPSHW